MAKIVAESQIEKWVMDNLSSIEKGLEFVDRQVDLGEFGRLDVLCKDRKGHYVIIELKSPDTQADESIVSQVFRYRTGLQEKYGLSDPSEIRILCFVNKMKRRVRKICKQVGIGVADYDLKNISFPEKTVGGVPEQAELKHGIFPVRPMVFKKLDKICLFDVKQRVTWMKKGSTIVFYCKKRLVAEAKVIRIVRDFKSSAELDKLLDYPVGYLSGEFPSFFNTLIFYEGFRKYEPPIWWESYLQKFADSREPYPVRTPRAISDMELKWIRGEE